MSRRSSSRRERRTPPPVPTLEALAEADGAEVSELLREVSELRLALDTDLTIAAAAAEAVAELVAPAELSVEITDQALDAGRTALDELATRQRRRGARRAPAGREAGRPGRRGRRGSEGRLPGVTRNGVTRNGVTRNGVTRRRVTLRGVPLIGVGPLVGVAVALGLGTGFFASHLGSSPSRSQGLTNAADSSLHSLSSALGLGNDQAAREASNQLNAAISSLIVAAPGNPAAAAAAATALGAEQTLLAGTSGPLGDQLRASMAAQLVALQGTVHSPLATLLKPTSRSGTPTLTIPVPLPSRLVTALPTQLVLPPVPARPSPSHRPAASHSPDPLASITSILLPASSPPATPAATTEPQASPAGSPTPSSSAAPSGSPSTSPSASPPGLPIATGSGNYFPH